MSANSNPPQLSIIIVSWNVQKYLQACLHSLFTYPPPLGFETIVIDNASQDHTATIIRQKFPQVTLIANRNNRGFAAANNQGISTAQGKYLLILNPDTLILPNTFPPLLSYIEKHPHAGIIAPKLLNPNGTLQPSVRTFPTFFTELLRTTGLDRRFPHNRIFGRYHMSWWNFNYTRQVDQPMGACLLIRKQLLDQIGRFDEQFFMYFEEVDLCLRAKQAKWQTVFLPHAHLIHHAGRSSKQIKNQMQRIRNQSLKKYFLKHRPFWESWLLRLLTHS